MWRSDDPRKLLTHPATLAISNGILACSAELDKETKHIELDLSMAHGVKSDWRFYLLSEEAWPATWRWIELPEVEDALDVA